MTLSAVKDAPIITEIENFNVVVPWPEEEVKAGMLNRFNMVRVRTDSGITGYATGRAMRVEDLEGVKETFIGKTPFDLEQYLRPHLVKCASVEHALWDIIGKMAAMPVHKLWGGNRTEIKCCLLYTSPSPRDRQKSRMPSSA